METTIIKGKEVVNTGLILQANENDPFLKFFTITESTEKAIKVLNQESKRIGWLPKSALKHLSTDTFGYTTFTFEMWFRKVDNGQSIRNAFNLLY